MQVGLTLSLDKPADITQAVLIAVHSQALKAPSTSLGSEMVLACLQHTPMLVCPTISV